MDKETLDQLMEIKKLYEAGILTKEEMEAEKAKVLHPTTVVPENNEEQIAPCDVPQQAISDNNSEEQIDSADVPHQTISDNNNEEPKSEVLKNRVWFLVGSVVILIFFVAISQNGKCSSSQTYDDYATEVADSDTIAVVEDADEEVAMDEDQVEYTDATWVGSFTISGSMYRMCQSMALLSLSPSDGTTFTGKINLMLGNEDNMGRFDFFYGELTGAIRGELSEDGSSIRIYLEDYNVEEGRMGDLISNEEIQSGQLLFILKYSNYGYEVEPVMAMSSFFDGVADKTQIVKK